ncbi:tRNA dihydrouridine synthase DusB [Candidatus Peregrinibacteria bacterium CG_4_9_14_0_2_um_filter_53_11]|nr:MAG: tRNA dihydrouridine synthase DusB [Candidatus Peregrinibacteria bacterium CG_4_9_14_0_2_um_filter_53_11]
MSDFSWKTHPRPIVALAPMAGYTDSSYRELVKEVCPRVICFTEFTNIDGLLHGNKATIRQVIFNPEKERPIVAQLFGKDPEKFKAAAAFLTEHGVDAVDINMGCPAKKIVSSDHGSALLKDPSLAERIVEATVAGTNLPVSVKMRIGTSCYDEGQFFDFAHRMERAGAQLITVHGRTSKQMYGGSADWEPMHRLKQELSIPVIGNGDICSGADAVEKIGPLDGVMVGRGSFGNPWVFQDIFAALEGTSWEPPTLEEKLTRIERHIELACNFKDEQWGMLEMRKHYSWYIKGLRDASKVRQQLVLTENREEALKLLRDFLSSAVPV